MVMRTALTYAGNVNAHESTYTNDIKEVILTWLTQVRYLFNHRGHQGTYTTHGHVAHLWTRQHLTKYADEVNIVLQCFRRFHMRINLEKTKALLLSPKNPEKWLTLVSHTEYLGAVVSYDQYELQTMRHRIQKANNRRWALAPFLHSRRISIRLKLRIWRSCVLTTLLYGLSSCGISGDAVEEVQRTIMKHVRAIVSNQAHLTGDTHRDIALKYNIPSAKDLCAVEYQRTQDQQCNLQDWMYDEQWQQHLWCRIQQIAERVEKPTEQARWACPACDGIFPTQAALKWHARTEPDELEEFFGTVGPPVAHNKRRRSVDHQQMMQPRSSRSHSHNDDLVFTLAKVVVRQEEELKILKQDHSIVMWMKPGEASILHHLYQVAKAYKQKLQENPMWSPDRKTPRTVLAIAVFRELADRLNKVLNSEELLEKASDMGWRDANQGWPFQRWNPTLKCLEKDPHRAPLSDQTIQQTLVALQQSLDADTVTRFACTRKLTETMQGMATFLMDIAVRSPAAQESWNNILSLQSNTVLQLIG
ncbi:unnamed protein product, partial [Symbiodinium sp. KB8]